MNIKIPKFIKNINTQCKTISTNLKSKMSGTKTENEQNKSETLDSSFECNICLETAKDAVVSMCGHLFCWPCLFSWFEIKPENQVCPVCKAAISVDKVIPLYGRGFSNVDPRSRLPPRPKAQRTEPEADINFPLFGFGNGGLQIAFGIGAFPFGIIASAFNFGDTRPPSIPEEIHEESYLNKAFLYLAIIFFIWLLFA